MIASYPDFSRPAVLGERATSPLCDRELRGLGAIGASQFPRQIDHHGRASLANPVSGFGDPFAGRNRFYA